MPRKKPTKKHKPNGIAGPMKTKDGSLCFSKQDQFALELALSRMNEQKSLLLQEETLKSQRATQHAFDQQVAQEKIGQHQIKVMLRTQEYAKLRENLSEVYAVDLSTALYDDETGIITAGD